MPEERIGKVENFFSKINVAAIHLESGDLKVGDKIRIKGPNTDFVQTVDSMQIDRVDIEKAETGSSVGIKVSDRVRDTDIVYKVTE